MNKVRRDLKEQLQNEEEAVKQKKDGLIERTKEPVEDDMRKGWTAQIRAIIQSRVAAQVEQEVSKKKIIDNDILSLRTNTSSIGKSQRMSSVEQEIIGIRCSK